MSQTQDLKNHARLHPPFHFFTFFLLVANLVFTIIHAVHHHNFWNIWLVVVSFGIFIPVLLIRQYAVKVQDRVIRMEERVRLTSLAPPDFQGEISKLSVDQMVGLRFASDGEVVALAKQALEENLGRKAIKERIKSWRPDFWRV